MEYQTYVLISSTVALLGVNSLINSMDYCNTV